ncbi:uncharacterized protein LOC114912198 [Scleropages formosus]|uniref:uncharacterized protein LOC114912198 n=1 Tax=Scleropages formosus TaxID=113540 RepID=UPI0008789AAD|nr:uncharacterized protein LOC114912198 [Scleropages formosus]
MAPTLFGEIFSEFLKKTGTAFKLSAVLGPSVFINFMLKLEQMCVCKHSGEDNQFFLVSYMFCPALILLIIIVLMDKTSITCWPLCCSPEGRKKLFSHSLCCRKGCTVVMKGVFGASVWIISVLLDGDWYVCFKTSRNIRDVLGDLPCKSEDRDTTEENSRITQYYNVSRAISLILATILAIVWAIVRCCQGGSSYYKYKYEKYQERETGKALKEHLQELAKQNAKKTCLLVLSAIQETSGASTTQSQPPTVEQVIVEPLTETQRRNLIDRAKKTQLQQKTLDDLWGKMSEPDFCLSGLQLAIKRNQSAVTADPASTDGSRGRAGPSGENQPAVASNPAALSQSEEEMLLSSTTDRQHRPTTADPMELRGMQ